MKEKEAEVIEALANHLGASRFNKLVNSAFAARNRGRFVYWQEQMLEGFTKATGNELPEDFEAAVDLLESADPLPITFTREEFFDNPVSAWHTPEAEIPDAWVKEAVQDPRFREDLAYELARSVSKVGDFGLASERALSALKGSLKESQVRELYAYVRDESQRLEGEWRPAFESLFGPVGAGPDPLPGSSEPMLSGETDAEPAGEAVPRRAWWQFWK